MKLVMTLVVRDESDIIDAQIAFHLHAGVDFVLASDNGSEDGTVEILERYERAGVLGLTRVGSGPIRQDEWVTRMARTAASELGADWVLNSDADEFWWPRGGSLKELLGAVPARYGVVRACWRHFLPRPDDGSPFYERMTARLRTPTPPGEKSSIYHVHQKIAHRADPAVTVAFGNHTAYGEGLEPLRGWHPIEILHFSHRTFEQMERKSRFGRGIPQPLVTPDRLAMWDAEREGRLREYFDSFILRDENVEREVATGRVAIDTRLRDVLRGLRDEAGAFRVPVDGAAPLSFPRPDASDDGAYAAETALLADIDAAVRAEERVASFERRLERLERGSVSRLRHRLARR
jgi:Glycosyl transferase family 2